MGLTKRKVKYYIASFIRHDFKASVNVFLEAVPLCIGVALASGSSVYAGFVSGIIGGVMVSLISLSNSCVRGPAAGLATVCMTTLALVGSLTAFFAAVILAGIFQILLGAFKMGSVAHFIPSIVVKGMMTALGIMLIVQEIPYVIGDADLNAYNKVALFHFISFHKLADHTIHLWHHTAHGVLLISLVTFSLLYLWEKKWSKKIAYLPTYFLVVWVAMIMAFFFREYFPGLALTPGQYVNIPRDFSAQFHLYPVLPYLFRSAVWQGALFICLVATIEGLLNVEAVDRMDHYNRMTPRNRELIAQGIGNVFSGLLGGLPITTVIARSTTNIQSGGRTKLSSFFVGVWLLVAVFFIPFMVNLIPYCVLSALLIKIGLQLVKPAQVYAIYRGGRSQFRPFLVTVLSILFTDLLIGVLVGVVYSFYLLVKNTYHAEFMVNEKSDGHLKHYTIKLAPNVSFLNKRGIVSTLDDIPNYSIVEIVGSDGGSVDYDIMEAIEHYRTKAHNRHIELILKDLPELSKPAVL